ncbi:MAG: hydrogenase [Deltaproteobacteria bacterium]|jgi:hydrogenase-4 component E|nr:hydrogenase [Deltaproteobacteria bacterium]
MLHLSDISLVLILLSVLMALGSSRIQELIRIMAFQGVLVSLVPFLLERVHTASQLDILFLLLFIGIKGVVMPGLLWFASQRVSAKMELEPIIGYHASILTGLVMMVIAAFISHKMQVASEGLHPLLLPAAFTTIAAGLFLLVARHKALTQATGYLILENGIYLAGSVLAREAHTQFVVEFGILLDILVGIMVMGIIVHRISRSFDDADTMFLQELKG